MKKAAVTLVALLLLSIAALGYFLLRPLSDEPVPAEFQCYDLGQGAYVPLDDPDQAYGIGLSYAGHIQETASSFDSDGVPPVFEKSPSAWVQRRTATPGPDSPRPTSTASQ